jgi:Domain of unknown function (DUF4383)
MSTATAQKVSLAFGVVYLLVGVLGFIPGVTMPSTMPGQGLLLGIFAVNTVHNLAHLVVGAALIWAGLSAQVALINKGLAVIFAVLVVGSVIAPIVEGVAINPPDTALHLVSLIVTAYLGWGTGRRAAMAAA